jgi:hypothetical protein
MSQVSTSAFAFAGTSAITVAVLDSFVVPSVISATGGSSGYTDTATIRFALRFSDDFSRITDDFYGTSTASFIALATGINPRRLTVIGTMAGLRLGHFFRIFHIA